MDFVSLYSDIFFWGEDISPMCYNINDIQTNNQIKYRPDPLSSNAVVMKDNLSMKSLAWKSLVLNTSNEVLPKSAPLINLAGLEFPVVGGLMRFTTIITDENTKCWLSLMSLKYS